MSDSRSDRPTGAEILERFGFYRLDPSDFGPDWAAECTATYLDLVRVTSGPCERPTWRTPDHYSVCERHAHEIAAQWAEEENPS